MNLRIAFRSVWRDKTFAIMTLVLLSVGIAACTGIFTIVNTVLLRPLPYHQPDRIVTLWSYYPKTAKLGWVSNPDFEDWKQQTHSFSALAAYATETTNVFAGSAAERTTVAIVGDGFVQSLQATPEFGRAFSSDELSIAGKHVAMINHEFAQRRFGDAARAVGQTLHLYNQTYDVVGVLPVSFRFPDQADVWAPMAEFMIGNTERSAHNYQIVGRLRDGVTLSQADADLKTVAARLAQQYPVNAQKSASVVRLHSFLVKDVQETLRLLLASVLLLLTIACANVANLMLARIMGRRREMAVRAALGATRWQLTKQLLAESFVVAIPAGCAGLLLGYYAARAVAGIAPTVVPGGTRIALDWRVAAFAFLIAIASSFIFTVVPALQAGHATVSESLRGGGTNSVAAGPAKHLRAFFVVAELAGSLSLLVAAFLLLRSLGALLGTDPGYKPEGVLVTRMSVPTAGNEDNARANVFYANLLERTTALPDVQQVSAANALPNNRSSNGRFDIEGRPSPAPGDIISQQAGFLVTAPDYFKLLQIPAQSGRDFDARDTQQNELTCIVNEALVRQSFANENPIGHRIKTGMDNTGYMRIVGVVADVRQYGLDRAPQPIIYMPFRQHPNFSTALSLLVRPRVSAESAATSIRSVIASLDPELAVDFVPLVSTTDIAVAAPRFRTTLFSIFSAMALLLAAVGLYGVMSYMVVQRRREMGVRMALGAARTDVFSLVMREGARLVIIGLALGIPLAFVTSRIISGLIYGIKPTDPITFLASTIVLAIIGMLAAYLPAYRATRVELIEVLRQE